MLDDHDMDAVFQALASSSRRRMLDLLKESPGMSVGTLAAGFDVSRIAVMKHLRVLEDAQLLISRKEGRTRRLYFNAVPIQLIHERWMTDYSAYWSGNVTRLKYAAELREQSAKRQKNKKGRSK